MLKSSFQRTLCNLASVAALLGALPMAASAAPVTFTFTDTITVSSGSIAGVNTGDTLVVTIVADNGGSGLVSQSWVEADILSATAAVGSYTATFNSPYFGNTPSFTTNALSVPASSWFDIDGGNTDSIGPGSPGFFANALRASNGTLLSYNGNICQAGTNCGGRWTVALGAPGTSVPAPATWALVPLALAGLAATRRRALRGGQPRA